MEFSECSKTLQHDMFDGPIPQAIDWKQSSQLAYLVCIMLLGDLLPLRFPLSLLLFPPNLSPLRLFLIYSSNPPRPSPSSLPPSPTYLTVFKLMSTSPSDHAPQLLTQVMQ